MTNRTTQNAPEPAQSAPQGAGQPGEAPRRRPRLGLRRLMTWTIVWAAYLGAWHLWLGYLESQGVPHTLPVGMGFTVYVAILLLVRIRWGAERGAWIAVLGTLVALAGFVEVVIVMNSVTGQSSESIIEAQWILMPFSMLGIFLCGLGFLFAHTLAVAADWVDGLMPTKPPPED